MLAGIDSALKLNFTFNIIQAIHLPFSIQNGWSDNS
jgi:hypothetical protein